MKNILKTVLTGMTLIGAAMVAVPTVANAGGYYHDDGCGKHSFYGHGQYGYYGYIPPHWHDKYGHDTEGSDVRWECKKEHHYDKYDKHDKYYKYDKHDNRNGVS